ncbi:arylsulfatase [Chitinophaga barathri]|uniref:Arylsulfatase n=1 Tax=Chitinophaga barathri TaxID=1647451 RepID=A0A3N4M916_9BACT|nr:arylsulfatase [Chitinophaga barathri]RPD39785.1 arylsulfatase [Chitinophaga barathri]
MVIKASMLFVLAAWLFQSACAPKTVKETEERAGLILPDRRPGEFKGKIAETYKDSKPDFPKTRKAPKDAPNVVIILLDDVGFGATSTFGGPIPTPALEKLAKAGLKFNQWHTTALCSPTRAALLTGRNHHEAGFGVISEIATGYPGYSGVIPDNSATIGTILRDNGYNTAWFGKNHNTPDYETSQSGPFVQWPNNMGFEYFYGFNGGDTHQWAPALFENTLPVEPPVDDPNYHLMTDMTDRSIAWMRMQQSIAPGKPFFLYFAPGATHAPHHAPKAWADKFKGQFDQGWNKVSEETFNRMKKAGIIPVEAQYNPIPEEVGVWDQLEPDRKKVYARMMEVYAGFLAYADFETGRLLDAIDELGIRENTLVIYGVGDNGASAEGGFSGTLNEIAADFNSYRPDVIKDALKRFDEIGGPTTYNHYPVGWAMAMNAPLKYAKRLASHFGGTRNGLVISWPKRIKDTGTLRSQFHHCIDIVPTILEAAGLPQPEMVNGVKQEPMTGVSMIYTFDDKNVKSKRTTQYFEIGSSRAIYHEGWMAATTHGGNPWSDKELSGPFDQDTWELYDLTKDFTEHVDVSKQYPEKVKELKELFMSEAKKHNVLPLDDRGAARFSAQLSGRPLGAIEGLTKLTYYPGMKRLPEGSAPDVKNRSFTITAEIEMPAKGGDGVIITQGGLFAGWVLMIKDRKPQFVYNWLQEQLTPIIGKSTLAPGKHVLRFEFAYDGGGRGKGGKGVLLADDQPVGEARIEKTVPNRFSLDETLDVGEDTGTPVSRDYKVPFRFTGELKKVVIELK